MHGRLSLATVLFVAACARDDAPSGTTDDDGEIPEAEEKDAAGGKRDATTPKRDASVKLDAAKPRPKDCTPGFYDGDFNCVINGFLPWFGKLHFELVQESTQNGEFSTLSVVPGTRINGNDDSMGGMFTGELQGELDCASGKFTGEIVDGVYMYGPMPYQLQGPLEGSYRGDGGIGFDGTMGPLTSADFDIFGPFAPSAMCTWKASFAGDPPDASRP